VSLLHNQVISRDELYKAGKALKEVALYEEAPQYRSKWDLSKDANLERGIIYMAGLNEKEPACWVMLGIFAAKSGDKNLVIAAYEKAIELGSRQTPILRAQIEILRDHISKAQSNKSAMHTALFGGVVLLFIMSGLMVLVRRLFKRISGGARRRVR